MSRASQLPPIFGQYNSVVRYIQKRSSVRYTSTCPSCGGGVHPDGEWPDRCVWFLNGKPCGWCSRCNTLFWPDNAPNWQPPSPAELEHWRREREQEELARLEEANRRLALLRSHRLYEKYHDMMDEQARQWWLKRGIPADYQAFWKLGWEADTTRWGCPSATIPLFDASWNILNIKHRLTDERKGRYRYHVPGLPAPPFLCNPDADMSGQIIAIEGEIKAAVCYVALDDSHACIVGLPGTQVSPLIKEQLSQAERITVVLDPGADQPAADGWSPMGRLVSELGRERCAVLIPPCKIDDLILRIRATKWEVRTLLRQARPV